jgi:citrate-Mg2+:H+ or citrate-Ca2+:H+ symporter, CitMHS family
MIWPNLGLTVLVMVLLIFGGVAFIPKVPAPIIFEVAFAIALLINYRHLKDQRQIIEEHGANVMHVITMVLAAGIFIGILNGSGMSNAMGVWLADVIPPSMGSHWALFTAVASVPGTFMLSNDAFYLGVLPVLAQTGANYGFTSMQIGLAATTGQAFHLLSPLVGFIYLLLHLTGVDMGAWQRTAAKWSIGTFVIFLFSIAVFGGVPL